MFYPLPALELPKPTEKPWLFAAIVLYLAVAEAFWAMARGNLMSLMPFGVVQWMPQRRLADNHALPGNCIWTPRRCITAAALFARHFLHGYCRCMYRGAAGHSLFMSLTLLFVGMTARELIGRRHGRSAVLILIGCLGLIDTGPQLSADVKPSCAPKRPACWLDA